MDSAEFFRRFDHSQEIGRDITEAELSVFYDNGQEVGLWRENRATTVGTGSVLAPQTSDLARYWFAKEAQGHIARTADSSGNRATTRQSAARRAGEPER